MRHMVAFPERRRWTSREDRGSGASGKGIRRQNSPFDPINERLQETDSRTQRADLWLPRGARRGQGGLDCEFGVSRYK